MTEIKRIVDDLATIDEHKTKYEYIVANKLIRN